MAEAPPSPHRNARCLLWDQDSVIMLHVHCVMQLHTCMRNKNVNKNNFYHPMCFLKVKMHQNRFSVPASLLAPPPEINFSLRHCGQLYIDFRSAQWRRALVHVGGPGLRPPLSLRQSSFFPSLVDSPRGLGTARSTAAKHFDAISALKQLYKSHIQV